MSKTKKVVSVDGELFALRKSIYTVNLSPVHVADAMTGKMHDIPAVGTACVCNPICIERMKNGEAICSHCFAETLFKCKPSCLDAYMSNYKLLSEHLLSDDLIPVFKPYVNEKNMVRIENFGDVGTVIHALNYLNMIRLNPHIHFAWWTKNPEIIRKALALFGEKPENVKIVYSSFKLDTPEPAVMERYPFLDSNFTVYRLPSGDPRITCGARDCLACGRCYLSDARETAEALK